MRKISMIAAVAKNGAIGKDGKIPWDVKADMKFFREYTMDKIIIMGSKTAQSLGKPLQGRMNVVITSTPSAFLHTGFDAFRSIPEALAFYENRLKDRSIVFIGGSRIYEEGMKYAEEIVLSRIPVDVEDADTFFPFIGENEWADSGPTVQYEGFSVDRFYKRF